MAPGWADKPGATDQDQEDARMAISVCRTMLEIFGWNIYMMPRWDTFSPEQIHFLKRLAEAKEH